ncbi:hypothetical protein [Streptomyces sp. Ag109_O5-1]|uniref:hypothetical protein n=1 Tax=Streptomyces sp. Ag109_O5-1 TaxID=1938851 RepID=UPI000F4F82D2|nr:hypothetical protein [Streptomyces sp. Ag109_O5-1]
MPPTPSAPGRVRPADVVNDAIRALAMGARFRPFTDEESSEYAALVVEWAAADRAEVVEAA